ncbi:hypothetical protein [Asticcacaulis sp.]|uniref:hypothetical protein n=1 Tax=Asticcacaulis sp. TaxID=1872648 RepID=UPI00262969BC|nr:hypothetical protein [Asticcacaulis sp.]
MSIVNNKNSKRDDDFVSIWSGVMVIAVVLITIPAVILILKYGGSSIGKSDLSYITVPLDMSLQSTSLST